MNIKLNELIQQLCSKDRNDKIKEIIIINGYTVCYVGRFDMFYNNSNTEPTIYKEKLMNAEVKSYTYKPVNQILIAFVEYEKRGRIK